MYEYVQTATGWKLCWGGASLYRKTEKQRPPVVLVRDDGAAASVEKDADREPVTALSA
jgi:hypothetical protein